jgi:hypothetical protein
MPVLLALIIIAILITLTFARLRRERGCAGIVGWIRGQDLDGKGRRYYFNKRFGIGCKPDIRESGRIIEYKSASAGSHPYPSDVMQVAGEMIATGVEDAELRYGNGREFSFTSNSPEIKEAIKRMQQIVGRMQTHLANNVMPEGSPSPKKCARCSFSQECNQSACS